MSLTLDFGRRPAGGAMALRALGEKLYLNLLPNGSGLKSAILRWEQSSTGLVAVFWILAE